MSKRVDINAKKREQMLENILSTATDLFANNGFNNTTISLIAAKANIGKGTIYHYFSSKEEILETILLKSSEKVYDFINIENSNDGYQEIELCLLKFADSLDNNYSYWKLITKFYINEPDKEIQEKIQSEHGIKFYNYIKNIFENRLNITNAENSISFFFIFEIKFFKFTL